ncbi:1-acyl-sn-glycerol-3-phosphate acyltransferase [Hasllibacter halocynthiae]|uniref:1-acyl-sn-glycerol-3-phosphate acyltransferase n=1 Tax=Hasllibacter halocynthiae TaxID=595589 RepID=UPI001FE742BC|nr:1-acyl-sn-glycerol-3-phosphate acyltransferase [Hasllibacter halocynthiae]
MIRTMEWATGKRALLRRVRRLEAAGVPHGPAFWPRALEALGIDLRTPEAEIARLPRTGPLVVVANHPHGLVDGLALAALVARRRPDHAILARALLTGVREVEEHTIPVPFPHDPDARCGMLAMRAEATARLARGGCVALFPAGGVAAAERALGPAVEGEWSAFTAKLIRRSGAGVVPVRFGGRNSRAYQIAGRLSPVLRQGLLIHEVRRSLDRPIRPVIGEAIGPEALAAMGPPRRMMAALRARTLALEPS